MGDLLWAKGFYQSIRGRISSEWKLKGDQFTWKVTIPGNTQATLYCPLFRPSPTIMESGLTIIENGAPVRDASGLRFFKIDQNAAIFSAGSGEYEFMIQ